MSKRTKKNPTPIRFGDLYDEIEDRATQSGKTFSDMCRHLIRVGIQHDKPQEAVRATQNDF